MAPVFASLLPVFLIIFTGWVSRATDFITDKDWVGLERVTYVIFFPALVIDTLARADLASVPVVSVGAALTGAIVLISAFLLAARPALQQSLGIDGPSFTSLFQGSTRWNTFVAIAVAGSLFGQRGVALTAVAIAAMVPLLNVLALYVFVRYAGGPKYSFGRILITFVTNPFIWSCAVGLALNLLAPPLPKPVGTFVDVMGRASLAAGLLVVGAGLDVKRLARPSSTHLLAVILKLVVLPTLATGLARGFGIGGSDLAVTVVAASVPSAAASYVLARQLGGNAPLMAEILTLQTLFALVSMPVMMSLLSNLGTA